MFFPLRVTWRRGHDTGHGQRQGGFKIGKGSRHSQDIIRWWYSCRAFVDANHYCILRGAYCPASHRPCTILSTLFLNHTLLRYIYRRVRRWCFAFRERDFPLKQWGHDHLAPLLRGISIDNRQRMRYCILGIAQFTCFHWTNIFFRQSLPRYRASEPYTPSV